MRVRDRKRQLRRASLLWRKRHPESYATSTKRSNLAQALRHVGYEPGAAREMAKEMYP